jgi:hypothetical protein
VRVPREGPLPLSFAQQRLWFIDQLEPGNPFYHCAAALRVEGDLDVAALERALGEVQRRHEVLRSVFPTLDGRPLQLVRPATPLRLAVQDLSALPHEQREPAAVRLAQDEAQRPFDLAQGPLMRAGLLHLAARDHVILLTLHHIVTDGWSVGVLVREVSALYAAFVRGEASPLPEPALQYSDYAAWQREWLQGAALERELGYWRERLSGAPVLLEAAGAAQAPSARAAASAEARLRPELSAAVRAQGRREGATLFMCLLAAFAVALRRLTGQDDVSVGTDVANRNRGETEGLIGFFVNQLVLRTDLTGNPSLREVLRRVRTTALEAYSHQDLPFDQLVEALAPQRRLDRTPLFQAKLVLDEFPPSERTALPGLVLRPLHSSAPEDAGPDALFLQVADRGGVLGLKLTGAPERFTVETLSHLLAHVQEILQALAAQPESTLDEVSVRLDGVDDRRHAAQREALKTASLGKLRGRLLKAARAN